MKKVLTAFICLVIGCIALQLGPRFGFEPRCRILDTISLKNDRYVYLVQERNQSFFGPYSVGLVFVESTNTVSAAQLGFKEAYWWLAKLQFEGGSEDITVSMLGSDFGSFHPESRSIDVKPSFGGRTWHLIPTGSAIALSLARNKSLHGYPVPPEW